MRYKKITQCRACRSPHLFSYLYLGKVSPANNFDLHEKFPVEVLVCEDCYLSQLSVVVDQNILYSNYPYHSSVSDTFKKHCYELAYRLKSFKTPDHPLVIDIAANDGCLMEQFKRAGFTRFLGVEPDVNLATECVRKGFPCANEFWPSNLSKYICGQGASFITAQNVLAHVDDLHGFIKEVCATLDTHGVFIAEFPYLVDLIEKNEFDTIYHEHLSYFLLNPLHNIFASLGLPIFKVECIPIHGGSLRIYASKSAHEKDDSIKEMLQMESMKRYYQLSTYSDFAVKVFTTGSKLIEKLEGLEGKKIMGYGASAKGISLINYFGLGRFIHSIVDDTPHKQGKRIPGSGIPIVSFDHFEREKPDYILLLAWNFADELIAKTRHLGAKYIVPIPEIKII